MPQNDSVDVYQVAGLCAIGGFVLIAYTTLFPFDFHVDSAIASQLTFPTLFGQFDRQLARPAGLDWFRNILLFIPLSYGLAGLLAAGRRPHLTTGVLILGLCLALSYSVELLQLFLPERASTLSDVLANGAGALVGLLIHRRWGQRPLHYLATWFAKLMQRVTPRILLALYAGYTVALVLLVKQLLATSSLHTWDPTFPLVLGNEASGDRPWRGLLSDLALVSEPPPAALGHPFSSAQSRQAAGAEALMAHYPLSGPSTLQDENGQLPDLVWQGSGSLPTGNAGSVFTGDRWLSTLTPVSLLNEKVAQSSQFTLTATIATTDPVQSGPARIISISRDPFQRNFTLGQEGTHLVLRLRTGFSGANALYPELRLTQVFTDSRPHPIIVAYRTNQLRIQVDAPAPAYLLDLAPQLALFAYLRPVDQWVVRLDQAPIWVYGLLYHLIVFFPLGVMLGLIASGSGRITGRLSAWIGAGLLFAPGLLALVSASPDRSVHLALAHFGFGVLALTGATLCTCLWARR
jgi:VanZ family protein